MRIRFVAPAVVLCLVAVLAAMGQPPQPVQSQIHRNGFSAKETFFLKGDANIAFAEKDHKISAEHHKSAMTSEYVKIEANPPGGAADKEFVHYYYECPPAPLTEQLVAKVNVKSYRAGVQVKARVVLPKEKDPKNPDSPLTTLIPGETYDKVRQWQALGFGDPIEAFRKHMPVLHARLGRAVDPTDAYIDRIVLNVYSGTGVSEVWIDDLEVGPIRPDWTPLMLPGGRTPGATTGRKEQATGKTVPVEFSDAQILVDGEPFFMLAVRHSDTPLKTLRDAQFNTIWFPNETSTPTIDEAIRHGFWIVPTLPLPAAEWDGRKPKRPDPATLEKDATAVAAYLRKFLAGDAVLMWDFGGGRTAEDLPRVIRASEIVRTYDPRRPRAVDLWDGYSSYTKYVNAVGAHRWPLFSSLEMGAYKDWMNQRRALVSPGKLMWTWVQTHLPDWYVTQLCGKPDVDQFTDPIGPHPEQIRILTYLSIAAGCRGLGFWSDKYLSKDTHNGRDRLLEIALINAEIDMLKPVLFAAQDPAVWVGTSDPSVQAAIIRGPKELIVMPVWLGAGAQYCPSQAVVPNLVINVGRIPEGSIPWRITAAGIEQMQLVKRVANGWELTIPEFDTAAAIVFTTDLGVNGKVVRWQDHTRFRSGETASKWAHQQAIEQYEKTMKTHQNIILAGGPEIPETADLFCQAKEHIDCAAKYAEYKQWYEAYRESRRALRPLRVLMRADWQKATETLDIPTASPFAVSFYSLPQHWQFAKEVGCSRLAGNGFAHGGFELSKPAPEAGAAVDSLPGGWKVRKSILDSVDGVAAIVNTSMGGIEDKPVPPPIVRPIRNAPLRVAPQPQDTRKPELGQHCLRLSIADKPETEKDGTRAAATQALERAILAVDSPPNDFAPGSLVRVSFWVKVPTPIQASADGVVIFDSAGGEPLGVRISHQPKWRQYHLYRRVPPSGKISMTFALTGIGTVFIDDVKIEAMVGGNNVARGQVEISEKSR